MFIFFSLPVPKTTHFATVLQEFLKSPWKVGNEQCEGDTEGAYLQSPLPTIL